MITLVRTVVAVGLVVALFWFHLIDLRLIARIAERPADALIVLILLVLTYPLAAWRWHRLLGGVGLKVPLIKVIQITFIGQFFSVVMPGAYGGDAVRLWYVHKTAHRGFSRILFSLLVDRLSGLSGLLTLGVGSFVLFRGRETSLAHGVVVSIVGVIVAAVAIVLGAVLVSWAFRLMPGMKKRIPSRLLDFVREMVEAFNLYRKSPAVILFAWLVSMLQYLLILGSILIVAKALNIGTLSWLDHVIVGTWSLITNAVPLTPGGIGLGEAAYGRFARLFEAVPTGAAYATIFLVFRALTVVASLPGAVLLLIYKNEMTEAIQTQPEA